MMPALVAAASLSVPLLAQPAEKPLADILKSIEEAAPPPEAPRPPIQHAPVPATGIGTTPLPPSEIAAPFGPATSPIEPESAPAEITEAERQAQWEAAERARLEALDRARAEREAATRRAQEAAMAEYERKLAVREAAIAEAEASYRAEVERVQLQAERERALWEARVRACRSGDRSQCARPEDYR